MMRPRNLGLYGLGLAIASALAAAEPLPETEANPPGSARNKPSGSKPVPGGGKRERERRMARLGGKEGDK